MGGLSLGALAWLLVPAAGGPEQLVMLSEEEQDAPSKRGTGEARLRRLAMPWNIAKLDEMLTLAGRPVKWPVERLLTVKLAGLAAASMTGIFLFAISPSGGRVFLALIMAAVGYFTADLILYSRGKERQAAIERELADVLDQMNIAVEAGLGFDSAMSRLAKSGKGPIASEFTRTLQDMQVGRSRREAYEDMGRRTTVRDFRIFISQVVQAEKYGLAIAGVLRTQAQEIRIKRRQRAEEQAMKIPVKVVFPLMLFILPVLFIVLLAPAGLDIMTMFSATNK